VSSKLQGSMAEIWEDTHFLLLRQYFMEYAIFFRFVILSVFICFFFLEGCLTVHLPNKISKMPT